MREVHQVPDGDQGRSLSAAPLVVPPLIRWCEQTEVRAWLTVLREQVLDGFAAGEDATRRPTRRMVSRHEARRRLREAQRESLALLDAALRSLVLDEGTPGSSPAGSERHG